MAEDRKQYDWQAIEREFRAGQLSIREIARIHDCSDTAIRKKMKQLGVERDLTQQIAQKVRNALVREQVRADNPIDEKEVIDTAAARVVEIVRSHQRRIASGGKIVESLFAQLGDIANHREEIENEIEKETADDKTPNRRAMMLKAVSLASNSSTAVSLSLALKNLVGLERQAFNVEVGSGQAAGANLDELSDNELLEIICSKRNQ